MEKQIVTDFGVVQIESEVEINGKTVLEKDAYVSSFKLSEIFDYNHDLMIELIEKYYYDYGMFYMFIEDHEEEGYYINYDALHKIFSEIGNNGRNYVYKLECLVSVIDFIEKNNLNKRW